MWQLKVSVISLLFHWVVYHPKLFFEFEQEVLFELFQFDPIFDVVGAFHGVAENDAQLSLDLIISSISSPVIFE